jgi:hypothetical protein
MRQDQAARRLLIRLDGARLDRRPTLRERLQIRPTKQAGRRSVLLPLDCPASTPRL